MRRWGVVVTGFYAAALVVLLGPVLVMSIGGSDANWSTVLRLYRDYKFWTILGILVGGQALLLFLSVDQSDRRLKPRSHIALSVVLASFLFGVLITAAVWTIGAGVRGDQFQLPLFADNLPASWLAIWAVWAVVFLLYFRRANASLTRVINWLLKGSVLEFLIAIPCHVIARRRHECCAHLVTAGGLVTGVALMLMCFGPSVLFLFKKRMETYKRPARDVSASRP